MKTKILIFGLICIFVFIYGCDKQLPTSPDITERGFSPPYDLTATVISASSIDLNWKNGSGYRTIEVYRNAADTGYMKYAVINGNKEHWQDVSCMPGIEYCYKVKGRWQHPPLSVSGYSNETCGMSHNN